MLEKISPVKKTLNFYGTVLAAGLFSIFVVLLFFLGLAYVLGIFSKKVLEILFFISLVFLFSSWLARAAAIILLEGLSGWFQGLKVLTGDFLFILLRPKLWKLSLISFYFPYHLANWEAARLDLKKLNLTSRDLIYGETPYFSIKKIIQEVRPGGEEDLFVDLGSGIGKVVFFVALNFGLPAMGIEINPALYRASLEIKDKLKIKKAVFVGGNVLEEEFPEGSIFYVHGTSWSEEVYQKLTQKFEEIKPGALVLSVTHPLTAPFLKLVKKIKIDLNWSREPLFIYQRLA